MVNPFRKLNVPAEAACQENGKVSGPCVFPEQKSGNMLVRFTT
tara:strand:- start:485 stop:613 length:129 start_codon:yes stop_codon:yes gene_type:complete